MSDTIESLKKRIDSLDNQLMSILSERLATAYEIMELKDEEGKPVADFVRENDIITRLHGEFGDRFDMEYIHNLYNIIFTYAKRTFVENKYPIKKTKDIFEIIRRRPEIIAGPGVVESKEQILDIAEFVASIGIKFLRCGGIKPENSPGSYQGMGIEGLKLMREAADKFGLFTVCEVSSVEELEAAYEYIDIIHIGAGNYHSPAFLKTAGSMASKDRKPVIFEKDFCSSLDEFRNMARIIMNEGNPNIILCLNASLPFEPKKTGSWLTPDIGSIIDLKYMTEAPVFFAPSRYGVSAQILTAIVKEALLYEIDGLLIDTDTWRQNASSEVRQGISLDELRILKKEIGYFL